MNPNKSEFYQSFLYVNVPHRDFEWATQMITQRLWVVKKG
jgi:hypothetical protein